MRYPRFLPYIVIVGIMGGTACVSAMQFRRMKASLETVQEVCTDAQPTVRKDGWGFDIIVLRDPIEGTLVVSPGRDNTLDRPIEEYWDPTSCDMTTSLDADIVCVNGRLRQWPELNPKAIRRLVRLPFDCEP